MTGSLFGWLTRPRQPRGDKTPAKRGMAPEPRFESDESFARAPRLAPVAALDAGIITATRSFDDDLKPVAEAPEDADASRLAPSHEDITVLESPALDSLTNKEPVNFPPAPMAPERAPSSHEPAEPTMSPPSSDNPFADAAYRASIAARQSDDREIEEDGSLPRFRFLASDMSLASASRSGSVRARALQNLREAFTPTQPKQSVKLFAGRRRELARIVSAIEEWKAHVVIYGERGYGKSSLANVVVEIARQGGITVLTAACSSEITFEEMFRGFLKELPLPYRGIASGGGQAARREGNFASLLPAGAFGATELTEALRHLTDRHVIFRIDEFDRIRDVDFKNQLAEAIKNLSDTGARVTFLIVGVAEDLDDLLGKHPSIQRNVVGIHLALMSEGELTKLIKAGERAADIQFEEEVRARIIALAQGLPYQAQLLALHCGAVAIEEGVKRVKPQHLTRAIDHVINLAPRAMERSFERAFARPEMAEAKNILFAAALSPCDPWGYFKVFDLAKAQRSLGTDVLAPEQIQPVLDMMAEGVSMPPLLKTRIEHATPHYAFADPLLRAYVLLRVGRESGLI